MNPALVRSQPDRCCQAVLNWLAEMRGAEPNRTPQLEAWFGTLVERPLRTFIEGFPWSNEELGLLEQTLELVADLRAARIFSVFEHGDLSHPNLMLMNGARLGVVDWELATPQGLPAYDLFFLLSYVAFARHNARTNAQYLAAFQSAFFGPTAWAGRWVRSYATGLQLPESCLTPLFVVAWFRYIAGLVGRLNTGDGPLERETATWLRENRYYALWQYAARHADELRWH
jgi:aminoglycoside phosphotransferase (APT) family kinase protein